MQNGFEWAIKAPASRTLGYSLDSVAAKVLRIKSSDSKDGREHSVFIVYDSTGTGGIPHPREIVLGSIRIKEANSVKAIKSCRLRLNLDGHSISAMRAEGIVGKVKQQALSVESAEVKGLLEIERKLFLRDIELSQLTK